MATKQENMKKKLDQLEQELIKDGLDLNNLRKSVVKSINAVAVIKSTVNQVNSEQRIWVAYCITCQTQLNKACSNGAFAEAAGRLHKKEKDIEHPHNVLVGFYI